MRDRWHPDEKCGVPIDGNGNLLSDGTTTYTWDARDRLVSTNGGPTYGYDTQNLRVRVGDQRILLNGIEEVREYGTGNLRYDRDPMLNDGLFAEVADGSKVFLISDAQGSIVGKTDDSQTVIQHSVYDVAGAPQGNPPASPWGFQGRRHETYDPSLLYFRQRYAASGPGTWLSPDPAMSDRGRHVYRYLGNNPSSQVDPFGLSAYPDASWHPGLYQKLKQANATAMLWLQVFVVTSPFLYEERPFLWSMGRSSRWLRFDWQARSVLPFIRSRDAFIVCGDTGDALANARKDSYGWRITFNELKVMGLSPDGLASVLMHELIHVGTWDTPDWKSYYYSTTRTGEAYDELTEIAAYTSAPPAGASILRELGKYYRYKWDMVPVVVY